MPDGKQFVMDSRTESIVNAQTNLRRFVNLLTKYYVIDSIIFGTCGCLTNRCREIYFEEEKKW